MPTKITKTVKPNGGGDYLTLVAAIAGEKVAHPGLVAGDWQLDIVCYPGIDAGGVVTVDGFTTDATHYVNIVAAVRHQGVFVDDGTYYLLDCANSQVIVPKVNFMRLDGLMYRATLTAVATPTAAIIVSGALPAGAFDIRMTNCYGKGVLTGITGGGYHGFINSNIDDANGKVYLINNIFEGFHNTGTDLSDSFAIEIRSAPTLQNVFMYNNTAIRCQSGFRPRAYCHMKNNLAVSCWSGYRASAANNDSATNGSTDIKGVTPLSAFNLMGLPVLLRDPSTGDFRLSPSDQFMLGSATDLSADANYPFNTDIAGNVRPTGAWALGASQPVDAAVQGIRWLRAGALTAVGAQVKAKMMLAEPSVNVNLWVSLFSDLRNPTIVQSAAPSPGNVATFDVSGLIANTTYYYGITVGGGTVPYSKQGKFTTAPKPGPASFVFGASGDSDTGSSDPAFLNIRDAGALFFLNLGDTHYDNIATSDATKQRRAHDNRHQSINQSAMYRALACDEIWDDHDWGGNNSNRTSPAGPAAATIWREMMPHYAFPDSTGIYHSFVIGRCRFIITDQRSAADPNNSGTASTNKMLGDTQLAWFKNELLLAKNAGQLIFWGCPRPWLGTDATADGGDHWAGFSGERKAISDFCQANGIVNLVRLCADIHHLALDDGTNDKYTTDTLGNSFVTAQLAPLHQNDNGDLATGPYSTADVAIATGNTQEGTGGYGIVTVTDDGVNSIQVNIKGFYGTIQQFTFTKTYNVPTAVGGGALHGSSWAAIGTVGAPASKLYAFSGGSLVDITPGSGLANGGTDGKYVGGNYGDGLFGLGVFGVGNGKAQLNDAATWSLDNFGDWLVASCTSDGKLWYWNRDTSTQAQLIDGAPVSCGGGLVVTPERFLMALGANGKVRRVKWPSQETLTAWASTSSTTAGEFDLQTRGQLICGRRGRNETFLWTDVDMWIASYIGGDFIYAFEQKGDSCGIIGPNAVAVVGDSAFWMSHDRFFMYDGVVKPLDCDVAEYVFKDLNLTQRAKVSTTIVAQFDEVWWFYPSASQTGLENDRYVVYNWRENHWAIGNLNRCVGVDKGVFETPLWVDSAGGIYSHETGNDRTGGTVFAESGPFEIDAGDQVARVQRLIPDENTLGDIVLSFFLAMFPTDTELKVGPFAAAQPTDVRFTTRQARVRIDESRGVDWRFGILRLGVIPGGRR